MANIAFPGSDFAALTAVGASGSDVVIVSHVGGVTAADKRRSMTLTEVAAYNRGQLLDNDATLSGNSTTKGPTQQAIKTYVDNVAVGRQPKDPVRAATTVNGADATAFENGDVIDGVTLATGDRILRKNQTDQTKNGIFIVQASGAPVRSADADADAEIPGAEVLVLEGTVNANTQWTCSNTTVTIGTTAITFVKTATSGITYAAGARLQLVGSTFSVPDNAIVYAALQNVSATKRVLGRNTAGAGDPEEVTASQLLDWVQTPVVGSMLVRGAGGWFLQTPGLAGQVQTSGGPGAVPDWSDVNPVLLVQTLTDAPPDLSGALVAYGTFDRGVFRDAAGTVPAVRDGDSVAYWRDAKAGTYPFTQSTVARQPRMAGGVPQSSHAAYQYLANASIPVNARSLSVFLVVELNSLRQGFDGVGPNLVQYRVLFRGGADICNFYYDGVNKVLQVFGGTAQPFTTLKLSCTRALIGLTLSATEARAWVNADSEAVTVLPAASGTGMELAGWSASLGGGGREGGLEGALFAWAVYNRGLTTTEVGTNVYPWAQGIGAIAPANCDQVLACDGDSITSGVGATFNRNWFRRLAKFPNTALYNFGEPYNRLGGGPGGADMIARGAEVDAAYQSGKKNLLLVWGGTNDDSLDGASAATIYSRLTTYCAARRATGWELLVITTLPRIDNDAGKEAVRVSYNASILSGFTGFAEGAFDIANATYYPQFVDPLNQTNFPDGVHPGNGGNIIIAAGLQPNVNFLLG